MRLVEERENTRWGERFSAKTAHTWLEFKCIFSRLCYLLTAFQSYFNTWTLKHEFILLIGQIRVLKPRPLLPLQPDPQPPQFPILDGSGGTSQSAQASGTQRPSTAPLFTIGFYCFKFNWLQYGNYNLSCKKGRNNLFHKHLNKGAR